MSSMTLSRYFAWRFFVAVAGVFAGVFVLVAFVDYIDVMRKASDVPHAPTSQLMLMSFYRVPQTMERLLPFSVLVGAMTCFFSLSRRMELVVARGAGMSVWQIIAPAMLVAAALGAIGTMVYNPVSASLREASKRIESENFRPDPNGAGRLRQRLLGAPTRRRRRFDPQCPAEPGAGAQADHHHDIYVQSVRRIQGTH